MVFLSWRECGLTSLLFAWQHVIFTQHWKIGVVAAGEELK